MLIAQYFNWSSVTRVKIQTLVVIESLLRVKENVHVLPLQESEESCSVIGYRQIFLWQKFITVVKENDSLY